MGLSEKQRELKAAISSTDRQLTYYWHIGVLCVLALRTFMFFSLQNTTHTVIIKSNRFCHIV